MDYDTLVAAATTTGSIKYHLNYSRIDAASIVDEAEAWIYSRLRVREMRATADVTISSGVNYASLPTGFRDPIHFSIPGYVERIQIKDEETFRSELGWDSSADLPDGPPQRYAIFDELLNFDHDPDQAYTGKMVYFKTPTALSSSNTTNWLTSKYPTLMRRVCLMFAAEERKEYDLMDRNEIKALEMIEQIKKESDMSYRGLEMDFNWLGSS